MFHAVVLQIWCLVLYYRQALHTGCVIFIKIFTTTTQP